MVIAPIHFLKVPKIGIYNLYCDNDYKLGSNIDSNLLDSQKLIPKLYYLTFTLIHFKGYKYKPNQFLQKLVQRIYKNIFIYYQLVQLPWTVPKTLDYSKIIYSILNLNIFEQYFD